MISAQTHLFQLPKDETYLNAAYMTPLPLAVEAAGIEGIKAKAQPGKITAEDFFRTAKEVRIKFSHLINNPDIDRIAIFPSVSYGMANVLANIPSHQGKEIIVIEDQFPSSVFPIQNQRHRFDIKTISLPSLYKDRSEKLNRKIIDSIHSGTAAVCIGTLLWTDGTQYDLAEISAACKAHQCLLILDGTQSVGALPFDWMAIQPDALLCAGYKWLMGPYGCSLGYFGPAFDQGIPIEDNWINRKNSEDFSTLTQYESEYRPKAQKYNVGEYSNFITLPMLNKSLEMVLEWQPERIQEYCEYLIRPLLNGVSDHPNFWVEPNEHGHAYHLIGIHLKKEELRPALQQQCDELNIKISFRGNCLRVSPHLYNTSADLYRLSDVLLSL